MNGNAAVPTAPTQVPYLLLVLDGDVHPELPAAWQDARLRWDDAAAHDRLLVLAHQHDGYVWLATRYRKLSERGDAVAQGRLQRVQRVVELSIMFRQGQADEPQPYRGLTRMATLLAIMFALGFALLKTVARGHASGAQQTSERRSERGAAMMVVMILVTALMAGMGTLVSLQSHASRGAAIARTAKAALHCAEAGLVAARSPAVANWSGWNAALAAGTEPAWFSVVDHDLDDDGVSDFTLTLEDNRDEAGANDATKDNDLTVYVVSTCTKYSETPAQLAELVRYNGGGNCYQAQLGGCGGNNNAN